MWPTCGMRGIGVTVLLAVVADGTARPAHGQPRSSTLPRHCHSYERTTHTLPWSWAVACKRMPIVDDMCAPFRPLLQFMRCSCDFNIISIIPMLSFGSSSQLKRECNKTSTPDTPSPGPGYVWVAGRARGPSKCWANGMCTDDIRPARCGYWQKPKPSTSL